MSNWKEEFDEFWIIINDILCDESAGSSGKYTTVKLITKSFISGLRQKDKEELIKKEELQPPYKESDFEELPKKDVLTEEAMRNLYKTLENNKNYEYRAGYNQAIKEYKQLINAYYNK